MQAVEIENANPVEFRNPGQLTLRDSGENFYQPIAWDFRELADGSVEYCITVVEAGGKRYTGADLKSGLVPKPICRLCREGGASLEEDGDLANHFKFYPGDSQLTLSEMAHVSLNAETHTGNSGDLKVFEIFFQQRTQPITRYLKDKDPERSLRTTAFLLLLESFLNQLQSHLQTLDQTEALSEKIRKIFQLPPVQTTNSRVSNIAQQLSEHRVFVLKNSLRLMVGTAVSFLDFFKAPETPQEERTDGALTLMYAAIHRLFLMSILTSCLLGAESMIDFFAKPKRSEDDVLQAVHRGELSIIAGLRAFFPDDPEILGFHAAFEELMREVKTPSDKENVEGALFSLATFSHALSAKQIPSQTNLASLLTSLTIVGLLLPSGISSIQSLVQASSNTEQYGSAFYPYAITGAQSAQRLGQRAVAAFCFKPTVEASLALAATSFKDAVLQKKLHKAREGISPLDEQSRNPTEATPLL